MKRSRGIFLYLAVLMLMVTSVWAVIPRDICLTSAISDACCVCPDLTDMSCCAMPCCAGHKNLEESSKHKDDSHKNPSTDDTSRNLPCWNVSSVDTLSLTLDPYRPQVVSNVALLPVFIEPTTFAPLVKSGGFVDSHDANYRAIVSGASNSCVLRI